MKFFAISVIFTILLSTVLAEASVEECYDFPPRVRPTLMIADWIKTTPTATSCCPHFTGYIGDELKDYPIACHVVDDVNDLLKDVEIGDLYSSRFEFWYSGTSAHTNIVVKNVSEDTIFFSGQYHIDLGHPAVDYRDFGIVANCTDTGISVVSFIVV